MIRTDAGIVCALHTKYGKYQVLVSNPATNKPAVITAVERLSHGQAANPNPWMLMSALCIALHKECPLELGAKKVYTDEADRNALTQNAMEKAHANAAHPASSPVYIF